MLTVKKNFPSFTQTTTSLTWEMRKKKTWRLILIQMADQAENCCSIVGHLSSEKIHKERHLVIPNFIDTCLFPTRRQSSTWQIDPVMQVISSHFR